ncbi:MAG: hypothetical protein JJU33_10000 [Phycisphaerales bacterium]|nr:hypothetical protein [Phycisphaerales bacterium]
MRRTRTTTASLAAGAALLLGVAPASGQLEINPPTSEPRTASAMSEWDRAIPEGAANVTIRAVVPIGGSRVLLVANSQRPRGMAPTSNSLIELDLHTGEWTARHPFARRVDPIAHAAGKVLFSAYDPATRNGDPTLAPSVWLLDTEAWSAEPLLEPGEELLLAYAGWLATDGSVAVVAARSDWDAPPRSTVIVYREGHPEPLTHNAQGLFRYTRLMPDGSSIIRLTVRIEDDPELGGNLKPGVGVLESIDTTTGQVEAHDIELERFFSVAFSPDGTKAVAFTVDDDPPRIDLSIVNTQQSAVIASASTDFVSIEHEPVWVDRGVLVGFRTLSPASTAGAVLFNENAEEIDRWVFPGKEISSWFSLPGEEHPYAVVDNEDIVQLLPDGAFRPVWSLRLLDK